MIKPYWKPIRMSAVETVFGDRQNIREILSQISDTPVSRKTVNKWYERDSIPPEALILLAKYAAQKGRCKELMAVLFSP